jgi:hypothetical protein
VFDPAKEASEHRHVGGEEQGREGMKSQPCRTGSTRPAIPTTSRLHLRVRNAAQPTRHDRIFLAFPIER